MTNETTCVLETELPINFTCADGTGIEKGAILKLTDSMTASLADGDEDIVAGIAATEKIENDGTTSVAVYRRGIFRMQANGAIDAGDVVATAATSGESNEIDTATASAVGCKTLGIALEDIEAGSTGLVELNIGANIQVS
jgi:predicted RecA/RadA family phage recombinase